MFFSDNVSVEWRPKGLVNIYVAMSVIKIVVWS